MKSLDAWRLAEGVSSLQIYFQDGSTPVLSKNAGLVEVVIPPPPPSFLKIALRGDKTSTRVLLDEGADLIRGIVPIKSRDNHRIEAALVIDQLIPRPLANRLRAISSAFGEYQEAKRMKGPVKTIYILMLLMVALLVIFIGFWFGVTMARDITDPILALAGGTERIASGDLDVHIEPVADDELGVLVRSFNKMTGDLRQSRDEVVKVNLDLESRRKYMETVLTNIAAGVLALDSHGCVTAINDPAKRLLGITEPAPLRRAISDVFLKCPRLRYSEILHDLTDTESGALERQIALPFPEKVFPCSASPTV